MNSHQSLKNTVHCNFIFDLIVIVKILYIILYLVNVRKCAIFVSLKILKYKIQKY